MNTPLRLRTRHALGVVLLISTSVGPVAGQVPNHDFWLDRTLLRIEIETDLYSLRVDDRQPGAGERTGVLRILGDSVSEVSILLETRGRFRLDPDNCRYPPLRITIVGDSVEGIPPELSGFGRRARLVSSCKSGQEDIVRLEYSAYRLRRVLDEWTYLVRPASARFIDSTGRD